jgi:hypothetical protein
LWRHEASATLSMLALHRSQANPNFAVAASNGVAHGPYFIARHGHRACRLKREISSPR